MLMFFFSSRRRHTRSLRDWSSDVCSSDLSKVTVLEMLPQVLAMVDADLVAVYTKHLARLGGEVHTDSKVSEIAKQDRSEERRVGKECRSRGARCREKKKK